MLQFKIICDILSCLNIRPEKVQSELFSSGQNMTWPVSDQRWGFVSLVVGPISIVTGKNKQVAVKLLDSFPTSPLKAPLFPPYRFL